MDRLRWNGYAVTGVLAIVEIRVINARQIPQNNGVYCAIRTIKLTALVVITATRQKCQGSADITTNAIGFFI
ncbi:MAG: hypothetical protein V8Q65_00320 [Bacteroidaceae bacterium]